MVSIIRGSSLRNNAYSDVVNSRLHLVAVRIGFYEARLLLQFIGAIGAFAFFCY